jgi:hypothetical protein
VHTKKSGLRLGNWLTAEEARRIWQSPDADTLKGKRDWAILAVLLGCESSSGRDYPLSLRLIPPSRFTYLYIGHRYAYLFSSVIVVGVCADYDLLV